MHPGAPRYPHLVHVWTMATRQQWFETLRVSIAQEHGEGWIVRELGATSPSGATS